MLDFLLWVAAGPEQAEPLLLRQERESRRSLHDSWSGPKPLVDAAGAPKPCSSLPQPHSTGIRAWGAPRVCAGAEETRRSVADACAPWPN